MRQAFVQAFVYYSLIVAKKRVGSRVVPFVIYSVMEALFFFSSRSGLKISVPK